MRSKGRSEERSCGKHAEVKPECKKNWMTISRAETLSAGAVSVWKRTNSKVTERFTSHPITENLLSFLRKECGYVLVGQKKRNLAIPLNLSVRICLQCASSTIKIPLKMPEFRSCQICSAWLNYLLILFLPDLQTSEGPFIKEIGRLRAERTLGKNTGNGREGAIKMFRFYSQYSLLIHMWTIILHKNLI